MSGSVRAKAEGRSVVALFRNSSVHKKAATCRNVQPTAELYGLPRVALHRTGTNAGTQSHRAPLRIELPTERLP